MEHRSANRRQNRPRPSAPSGPAPPAPALDATAHRRFGHSLSQYSLSPSAEAGQTSETGTAADLGEAASTNETGLPDGLKAGVESLSGLPLDEVRVHYDSPAPAQVQALAYAQGTEIHVAPGQEAHLPHEAWHVVQQMEGRVAPTTAGIGGRSVNTESSLEAEAEAMGDRSRSVAPGPPRAKRRSPAPPPGPVLQPYLVRQPDGSYRENGIPPIGGLPPQGPSSQPPQSSMMPPYGMGGGMQSLSGGIGYGQMSLPPLSSMGGMGYGQPSLPPFGGMGFSTGMGYGQPSMPPFSSMSGMGYGPPMPSYGGGMPPLRPSPGINIPLPTMLLGGSQNMGFPSFNMGGGMGYGQPPMPPFGGGYQQPSGMGFTGSYGGFQPSQPLPSQPHVHNNSHIIHNNSTSGMGGSVSNGPSAFSTNTTNPTINNGSISTSNSGGGSGSGGSLAHEPWMSPGRTVRARSPGGRIYRQGLPGGKFGTTRVSTKTGKAKSRTKREAAGYVNPTHSHGNMLPLWEAAAMSPVPQGSAAAKRKHLMDKKRRFRTLSPGRTTTSQITGHDQGVLGHDVSAGSDWNQGGHKRKRDDNLEHNRRTSTFHGIERRDDSNASGASEERYIEPGPHLGSHPSYFNPSAQGFTGGPWPTYTLDPGAQPPPSQATHSITNAMPSITNAMPSITNAMPSITNAMPSITNAMPSITNAMPSITNAMPSITNAMPSITNAMPSITPTVNTNFPPSSVPVAAHLLPNMSQGPSALQDDESVTDEFGDGGSIDIDDEGNYDETSESDFDDEFLSDPVSDPVLDEFNSLFGGPGGNPLGYGSMTGQFSAAQPQPMPGNLGNNPPQNDGDQGDTDDIL